MGAIHDVIRREYRSCRICSWSDWTARSSIQVTKWLECPKPGTPRSEVILVCGVCYPPARTILLLHAMWRAEMSL